MKHLKQHIILLIVLSIIIPLTGVSQNRTNTRIRLFKQTTGFDSIVGRNDSLIFFNIDSIHTTYHPDLTDSTNEIIDSMTYDFGNLRIYEGGILNHNIFVPDTSIDNLYNVEEPTHGFTIPAYEILPVYYDENTSRYELAIDTNISMAAEALLVATPSADTIRIQNTGYVSVNHGLDVGYWYVLDSSSGGVVREDQHFCSFNTPVLQYLFFVPSTDKIMIQPELPKNCNPDFPLFQGFEDGIPSEWVSSGTFATTSLCSRSGTESILIGGDPGTGFVTNDLDATGCSSIDVSFWYIAGDDGVCGEAPDNGEGFDFEYFDGTTWVTLLTTNAGVFAPNVYTQFTATITGPLTDDFKMRWVVYASSGSGFDYWGIDDISAICN